MQTKRVARSWKRDKEGGSHPRYTYREAVALDTSLSSGARVLYCVLDDYARNTGKCFPKQATLARRLETSDRTIRRHLNELSARDYVTVEKKQYGAVYVLGWISDRTKMSGLKPSDRTKMSGLTGQKCPDSSLFSEYSQKKPTVLPFRTAEKPSEPEPLEASEPTLEPEPVCHLCGGSGVRVFSSEGGARVGRRSWSAPCECAQPSLPGVVPDTQS